MLSGIFALKFETYLARSKTQKTKAKTGKAEAFTAIFKLIAFQQF